ncbi:hypothetical protein V5O48_003430 [Marasmius crinis-equi]|uniref:Uncharacterized protein n=1 Tax=Marasmius crinis-equi TaxID=585013 RepID=A0ABR3FSX2_9AGAR
MLFMRLLLTILLPLYTLSVSPPSSIGLITPNEDQAKGGIGNGTRLPFGVYDLNVNKYAGLGREVRTSVTYPNGTTRLVDLYGVLKNCTLLLPSRSVGHAIANQDGRYTGHWNITYAMSTSPNESESGNFTLEQTIEVRLNGTTATGSPTPTVAEAFAMRDLGSQPTGSVGLRKTSEASRNIRVATAMVSLAVGLVVAAV